MERSLNKWIWGLVLCFGLTACSSNEPPKKETANAKQTQQQAAKDRVEILYFHGKQRCATCMAIEKNTKEAIETQLADELRNGTVVFRTIDLSRAENEKIAEKYEVTWSALFICQWKEGKETYENLTEYAFANARTAPDSFKSGVIERINQLLK